jgi:hypothetical protein
MNLYSGVERTYDNGSKRDEADKTKKMGSRACPLLLPT